MLKLPPKSFQITLDISRGFLYQKLGMLHRYESSSVCHRYKEYLILFLFLWGWNSISLVLYILVFYPELEFHFYTKFHNHWYYIMFYSTCFFLFSFFFVFFVLFVFFVFFVFCLFVFVNFSSQIEFNRYLPILFPTSAKPFEIITWILAFHP